MRSYAWCFVVLAVGCNRGPEPTSGARQTAPSRERAPATEEAPRVRPPSQPNAGNLPPVQPLVGGVGWEAPAPFVAQRPSNPMRAAEYVIDGHTDAVLTVSHFDRGQGGGGSVQDNVERWVGQFEQSDGRPSMDAAQIDRREVGGLPVTTIDVRGTFVGRMGMGPPEPPKPNYRMLGAIVEGRDGLVFFKLTGPDAAIGAAEGAFARLVESLHRA